MLISMVHVIEELIKLSVGSGAKVYKSLDCIKSIVIGRNLRINMSSTMFLLVDNIYFVVPSFTARQMLVDSRSINTKSSSYISPYGTPYDIDVISVCKQLDTFSKNNDIAINFRLSQNTNLTKLKRSNEIGRPV